MAVVSGDITEATFNHPTIGSGVFRPKAGEDNTYDLGGIKTQDEANNIDGGGQPIWVKNRNMGFFELVVSNDMNTAQDLEKIKELTESNEPAEWTFTVINGAVYKGTGMPVGDSQGNINAGTTTLKVAAPAFKKIAG